MKQNKNKKSPKPQEKISPTDPLGMYTGVPEDPYEVPEQDPDDL